MYITFSNNPIYFSSVLHKKKLTKGIAASLLAKTKRVPFHHAFFPESFSCWCYMYIFKFEIEKNSYI